jgi:4-diphosphocytidyl-2-C-methyl-D-erythritol kinase
VIVYPNAKINLGLHVLSKRGDGYHDIETIMYPVPVCDILEVAESTDGKFRFTTSGMDVGVGGEDNLVVKAYRMMEKKYRVKPVHIHLHKILPMGAGLGGGSADAAFLIKAVNALQELQLGDEVLERDALEVGSDAPFFIRNNPVIARGRGELMHQVQLDISGFFLVILMPSFTVSTAEAYRFIQPDDSRDSLESNAGQPAALWRSLLKNDFEDYVFFKHPSSIKIKEELYNKGAVYAQMSGSGAAFFGLFGGKPDHLNFDHATLVYSGWF